MKIEFDDTIRTGIPEVDAQHETLVGIYNELDEAFKRGKAHRQMSEILAKLFNYTKVHFETEEKLLEATGYPDLAQHQFEHRRLVEKLRTFVIRYKHGNQRISAEVVEFTRAWVFGHIAKSDMAFADHVKNARVEAVASAPREQD